MRVLAFVDVHGNQHAMVELATLSKEADILLCAGDISRFETDLDKILGQLDHLNKPVLMIHGNHEGADTLSKACSKLKNVVFFHKKAQIIGDTLFIGWGGGGFERNTPEMSDFFKKNEKLLKSSKKTVFMTHAPPYKTRLDLINRSHNGNNTLKNLILEYQPALVICGHFHENWEREEGVGKSLVMNPGPYGRLVEL